MKMKVYESKSGQSYWLRADAYDNAVSAKCIGTIEVTPLQGSWIPFKVVKTGDVFEYNDVTGQTRRNDIVIYTYPLTEIQKYIANGSWILEDWKLYRVDTMNFEYNSLTGECRNPVHKKSFQYVPSEYAQKQIAAGNWVPRTNSLQSVVKDTLDELQPVVNGWLLTMKQYKKLQEMV